MIADCGLRIADRGILDLEKGGGNAGGREALEINLLIEAIYRYFGYDFRNYERATLKRRLLQRMQSEGLASISGLQEKVLHDPECINRLLGDLSITVSALFRNPEVFKAIREKIVPVLKTYPFIRIWQAGCANGEEVWSLAVLLEEEGLMDRCRIYATDFNEKAIEQAARGIFHTGRMKDYTRNYIDGGGKGDFSEYYTSRYDNVIFRSRLKNNIVFSRHNLATDGPFNEFNLILCRNVMIYFDKKLQARAHELFYSSLSMFGFLVLGMQESIRFTPHEKNYRAESEIAKIYKKVK